MNIRQIMFIIQKNKAIHGIYEDDGSEPIIQIQNINCSYYEEPFF